MLRKARSRAGSSIKASNTVAVKMERVGVGCQIGGSMCTNASLYLSLGGGLRRKGTRWHGSDALDSE